MKNEVEMGADGLPVGAVKLNLKELMTPAVNKRIRMIQERHYGDSTSAMAKDIGLKPTTLADIVKGSSKPSYDSLVKILESDLLSISAKWLLLGEGDMYEKAPIEKTGADDPLTALVTSFVQSEAFDRIKKAYQAKMAKDMEAEIEKALMSVLLK